MFVCQKSALGGREKSALEAWDVFEGSFQMNENERTIEELKAEVERRSHPAAKVFPLLIDTDANAWEKFCADVADGLQFPILIDRPVTEAGWMILDGRNRELACLIRGIKPKYEVADVRDSDAVARVISANLRRRHDDVSVRAAQLAKLLEMLRVENFPTPPMREAAAAAGMSDRTLRDAGRLHKKDPELLDQVAKGNISMHAAGQVADMPPGEERAELKKKVAAAGDKKKAKGYVGEKKKREKQEQREFGRLSWPGLPGDYAKLLAVLQNLPKLANELRNLENAPHRLSVNHARELKARIADLKALDTKDLLAAADVAVRELDRIIAKGTKNVEKQEPVERPGEPVDAVADVEQEAA
jgi:hypothetical protein